MNTIEVNGSILDYKLNTIYYRLTVPEAYRINVMLAYVNNRTIPICTTDLYSHVDEYEYILPDIDLDIAERIMEQHVLFNNHTEDDTSFKIYFEEGIVLNYQVTTLDPRDTNLITRLICPARKVPSFKGYKQISLQGHLQNIKDILECLK